MRKLFFILFSVFWLNGISQVNLVPNPSFEEQLYCNPNTDLTILVDWYNPNTCTPDYYNMCWLAPSPQNFVYQLVDGDGFVGIATYDPNGSNVRDYVACQLLDTLQTGKLYHVSFYARIFYGHSRFASNNLGIHFSDTALHAGNMYLFNLNTPPLLEAQVKYFNNEVISDSAHWTLVSGLYQAHGDETWLTIGNFNTDAQTTQGMEYTDGVIFGTYFVIDMVSVIPLDSLPEGIPAYAGADTTIFINDTAFIGQKISNMPSVWHKLDGTQIASNTAGVYVSPQETTSYVVSHTLNGIFSADTVTVTVIDDAGMKETEKQRIELFPVPNEGSFVVKGVLIVGDILQIHSLDNKLVYSETFAESTDKINIQTSLKEGFYYVSIISKVGTEKYKRKMCVMRK